jgi:hypothetical protein
MTDTELIAAVRNILDHEQAVPLDEIVTEVRRLDPTITAERVCDAVVPATAPADAVQNRTRGSE